MEQTGEFLVPASKTDVWDALQDPDVLADCIDGCESMILTDSGTFEAVITAKFGPIKSKFRAELEVTDAVPPSHYTLRVNARSGGAGFGKGEARVELEAQGESTLLRYQAQGNVGGKLAQLGNRLVQGAARKLAEQFFGEFSARWTK